MKTYDKCSICMTPLQHRICSHCAGKGELGSWVFRGVCPVCDGTGRVAECPNPHTSFHGRAIDDFLSHGARDELVTRH